MVNPEVRINLGDHVADVVEDTVKRFEAKETWEIPSNFKRYADEKIERNCLGGVFSFLTLHTKKPTLTQADITKLDSIFIGTDGKQDLSLAAGEDCVEFLCELTGNFAKKCLDGEILRANTLPGRDVSLYGRDRIERAVYSRLVVMTRYGWVDDWQAFEQGVKRFITNGINTAAFAVRDLNLRLLGQYISSAPEGPSLLGLGEVFRGEYSLLVRLAAEHQNRGVPIFTDLSGNRNFLQGDVLLDTSRRPMKAAFSPHFAEIHKQIVKDNQIASSTTGCLALIPYSKLRPYWDGEDSSPYPNTVFEFLSWHKGILEQYSQNK